MRDDDRMLDLPAEFGSGVIGICDICGTRQAVIVLQKERFKLCVIDFLNKTWLKTDKKPGAPLPAYRSERISYPSSASKDGTAPGVMLVPTKVVRHPAVLITPDVYGITTTLLDGAIRLAREGFEVLVPDLGKTGGVGPASHLALRTGVRLGGGVSADSKRVRQLVSRYGEALGYLRSRELVDASRTGVLGVSYGASLALALAAVDTRLQAVALAYPLPVSPKELPKAITAPVFSIVGSEDRASARAQSQLEALRSALRPPSAFETVPGARHDFLARDLPAYDLRQAEFAWGRLVAFLKQQLLPPPPKPPTAPPKPSLVQAAVADARPPPPPGSAPRPAGGKPAPS